MAWVKASHKFVDMNLPVSFTRYVLKDPSSNIFFYLQEIPYGFIACKITEESTCITVMHLVYGHTKIRKRHASRVIHCRKCIAVTQLNIGRFPIRIVNCKSWMLYFEVFIILATAVPAISNAGFGCIISVNYRKIYKHSRL